MSQSDLKISTKKPQKWLSTVRVLFCCFQKNDTDQLENINYVTTSSQCDELLNIKKKETETIVGDSVESQTCPDVIEENADNFKKSLDRLQYLITGLGEVYNLYKDKHTENIQNGEKTFIFNIHINDNTWIHCHTKKCFNSLDSLEIADLTRTECTSTILQCPQTLIKSRYKPQKSFSTISDNFGWFSFQLLNQYNKISTDINILHRTFECPEKRNSIKGILTVGSPILLNGEMSDKLSMKMSDCKIIQARIRAANFCKFYQLNKKKDKEPKKKKPGRRKRVYK